MLKKIFGSKLLRFIFSAVLIYFAFKKVDVIKLFEDIRRVPLWFVVTNIIISFFIVALISIRWSLLLFSKIKLKTILTFTRASFLASYYSLIFPTAVAGDVLKWVVIDHKYPEIPKTKVLGSIILDRFIGFSMFMFLALLSAILSRKKGLIIPDYIFYLLVILTIICLLIYLIIYFFDVSKLFPKITFLHKLDNAFDTLTNENKKQIIKCLLISLASETIWILQAWFVSWKFGVGLNIFSIFTFMTIISIILVLPISIGGFGAREQLFLFFFSQIGSSNESILLMSAFFGILGIFNALFGGILSFLDEETRKKIRG
jgi:hypothetical protein